MITAGVAAVVTFYRIEQRPLAGEKKGESRDQVNFESGF
jgi:hypothetical protein